MWSLLTAECILLAVISVSLQDIRYVRPNGDSTTSCPSSPCLSIDQYAEDTTRYFTTGSTFIFLTGNHSIRTTLNITNIYNLTLQGDGHRNGVTMTIRSVNVTGLTIIGLTFNFMHTIKSSFLIALKSENIIILNSTFLSSGVSAIHCERSTITVINSFLQDNKGAYGAAIRISECNLTVIESIFTENKAVYGGAIDAFKGLVVLTENTFYLNSDRAIGCNGCTIKVEGLSIFENNTSQLKPSCKFLQVLARIMQDQQELVRSCKI